MDGPYTHGKFRFIQGDNSVPTIGDPADTGLDAIRAYLDPDPVLFSYMNEDSPRALLCNVSTDFTVTPPVSTGKYTVCVPTLNTAGTSYTWSFVMSGTTTKAKDVTLVDENGNPVAGNPYGIAQVGDTLYIVEYDSAKIYSVAIADLEAADEGGTREVTLAADTPEHIPEDNNHGTALIALTGGDEGDTYLFALYTNIIGSSYLASVVARYLVDPDDGSLGDPEIVTVGVNATGLVPVVTDSATYILVPAIGGSQKQNNTNGLTSNLVVIDAFNDFSSSTNTGTIAFTGDEAAPPTASTNYDIHGVASSPDGTNVYVLTLSYDASYLSCWRLYQTDIESIVANSEVTPKLSLSNATGLTDVAHDTGAPGYFWEVLYDNTAAGGRLWFLKGTPIQISTGDYATVLKTITYSGNLYDSAFNVNSADLIGETIYQAAQNASINTRLGTTRALAKTAQAAAASAAEEEEK
jgi:hypothetical protein